MLYITVFGTFITLLIIFNLLFKVMFGRKISIEERMNFIENMDQYTFEETKGFGERILIPILNGIGSFFSKFTPGHIQNTKKKMLERAGFLKGKSYERWLVQKFLLISCTVMSTGLIANWMSLEFMRGVIMIFMAVFFIQIVDRFRIMRAIKNRGQNMLRDLPFTLDLITVSVEAGLSLDGAIARIANNVKGVLSEEFAKTLKEMRMGIEKKKALKNMSERCDVREISVLMSALIQADELGVSLGKVLRIEGAQLRENRKQVAREKAMKAPIKMLFPLMLFIFPAIFVIILGPAVLQILRLF